MSCPRLASLCVLLMIACGSGVAFSQPDPETRRQILEDLQITQDNMQGFNESFQSLIQDMAKNAQPKMMAAVMERMKDSSSPPNQDEMVKLSMNIMMDEMVGIQKPLNDKAREFFSEEGRLKLQTRMFQAKESLIERLKTTENLEVIQGSFGVETMFLMAGQPDFLELSPEQRDLIIKQQKEASMELFMLNYQEDMRLRKENPEIEAEMQRLVKEYSEAQSDEERVEISRKIQKIREEKTKNIVPQMKKMVLDNHENYMRVLTDAQKAKIKAVMADIPDYMKRLLAELDKGEGGMGGLESWVPGAGVPGVNPNREAQRERSGSTGGRTFPGN